MQDDAHLLKHFVSLAGICYGPGLSLSGVHSQ